MGHPHHPTACRRVAGKGVAFARYETVETYVAVYVEVEVTTATGEVLGAAGGRCSRLRPHHQSGWAAHQIEGNVIQGISRTLIEEVGFSGTGVRPCCGPHTPLSNSTRYRRR